MSRPHSFARFVEPAHPVRTRRGGPKHLRSVSVPALAPNIAEAERFLSALAPGEAVTLQTFDDTAGKRKHVVRVLHGKLSTHAEQLRQLNSDSAGVFVTVNATDGKGRTADNITRVRAVFVDLDGSPLEPVRSCSLKPHIIIESSPGRWHAYWLVADLPHEQFTPVQKAIIKRFNGDKSVHDLPRVMRLPGFIHGKDEPALTRILEINEAPSYTAAQIIAEFPPLPSGTATIARPVNPDREAWVLEALTSLGLHRRALGDGRHEITCPWVSEHTNGIDGGTVYFEPYSRGKDQPGFKCHHNACAERNLKHLKVFLKHETGASLTDVGNMERFIEQHGQDVRYCHPLKKWFIWNGQCWQQDRAERIKHLVTASARQFRQHIDDEPNPARKEAMHKWSRHTESLSGVEAVIKLAQGAPELAVTPEQLNADAFALTVKNGTLDLRTGQLREARREDLITKAAPVAFDASATCPMWEAHLAKCFDGSAELIAYLRRVFGYALTGDASEECLFILHGQGANGKSTITEALAGLLAIGDQGGSVEVLPATSLEARKDAGAIRNDLAKCHEARVVLANEPKQGAQLDEAAIKALTTPNTAFTARYLHGEFFSFKVRFKLFVSTNHKPNIRGADSGIWRRLHYIPFTVQISPEERIPHYSEKLLAAEAAGILNWAIAGCLEWQRDGLKPPADVVKATAAWRESCDWLGQFLADATEPSADSFTGTKALYEAMGRWCDTAGREWRPTVQQFTDALKERGYRHARTRIGGEQVSGFHGIVVREAKVRAFANVDSQLW